MPIFIGGLEGSRTLDLLFAGQMLSQLSYEPINKVAVRTTFIFQKLLVSSVSSINVEAP